MKIVGLFVITNLNCIGLKDKFNVFEKLHYLLIFSGLSSELKSCFPSVFITNMIIYDY